MIALATAIADPKDATLIQLARIVEPYGRCHFAREPQREKLLANWSSYARQQYGPNATQEAAKKAEDLTKELQLYMQQTEITCRADEIQQTLRARLLKLHPKMDQARSFWMARSVFHTLNLQNENILRLEAGIFPPNTPAPPAAPPSPPR